MRPYEFEGKNEEDAVAKACSTLKCTREELQIKVLEPGSAGIFGLVGGRKARIRVVPIVKETVPEEKPTAPEEVAKEEQIAPKPAAEETVEEKNAIVVAKEALENILALIPMEDTEVTVTYADGTINLNIEGDKSGLLIGRKGKTLDALQFIVNKIVNKSLEKRCRVLIDSENYRDRRKDFLVEMAKRMGDKAKRIKKPVATNLLNPHDRRIVHLALKDDGELGTKGSGEGILKKVVIIPKTRRPSKSGRVGKKRDEGQVRSEE